MAGQAGGGQKLTSNPNVSAPAGVGGDLWGANGGGITPYSGSDTILGTQSRAATASNYQPPAAPPQALAQQINRTALDSHTADTSVASGGSTQG